MKPGKQAIQSFVIKILLSELPAEENGPLWYGHIAHVPSGNQQYFCDLGRVLSFIKPYMEEMGITFREDEDEDERR